MTEILSSPSGRRNCLESLKAHRGAIAALGPQPKIGLLGGSFNPAHGGHVAISREAVRALGLDGVWWLVSPANPLKDPDQYAEYPARLEQASRLAGEHPDVPILISAFERYAETQYTIDTLRSLVTHYPDARFVWLMGADNLVDFHRWRDWEAIAGILPMAVLNRPGAQDAALSSVSAQALRPYERPEAQARQIADADPPAWVYLTRPDNPESSTAIRAALQAARKGEIMSENADLQTDIEGLRFFLDLHPALSDFREDVLTGLAQPQKWLSPKYFYDEKGSQIFEDITRTEDYYPTRTELSLMKTIMPELRDLLGPGAAIFEVGSGASEKIRLLIEELDRLETYVAMDISRSFLIDSAQSLARDYPELTVSGVCADFNMPIILPEAFHPEVTRWTGYFPGSTIGNFRAGTATTFLTRMAQTLGPGARFLLGFDLQKDKAVLERAYNDSEGVTAAFNLNVLTRMKCELGADLSEDDFEHFAFYNEDKGRIEMHLRARRPTEISLEDKRFSFAEGETLHTEFSYKYTKDIMEGMLEKTPWSMERFWTDPKKWFAVALFVNEG